MRKRPSLATPHPNPSSFHPPLSLSFSGAARLGKGAAPPRSYSIRFSRALALWKAEVPQDIYRNQVAFKNLDEADRLKWLKAADAAPMALKK